MITPEQLARCNRLTNQGNLRVIRIDDDGPKYGVSNAWMACTPVITLPPLVTNPLRPTHSDLQADLHHNAQMLGDMLMQWWRMNFPGEDAS